MRQYGIYIREGSGTPYIIHFFNTIDGCKMKLYDMIQLEEERQRPYFVDNDFYKNRYSMVGKLKYFCIKVREVTEWENYTEEKVKNEDDKIIFIKDFKKVLTK